METQKPVSDAEAQSVTCPICGSTPGHRCYSRIPQTTRRSGPYGVSLFDPVITAHLRVRQNPHPERRGYYLGLREGRLLAIEQVREALTRMEPPQPVTEATA